MRTQLLYSILWMGTHKLESLGNKTREKQKESQELDLILVCLKKAGIILPKGGKKENFSNESRKSLVG